MRSTKKKYTWKEKRIVTVKEIPRISGKGHTVLKKVRQWKKRRERGKK